MFEILAENRINASYQPASYSSNKNKWKQKDTLINLPCAYENAYKAKIKEPQIQKRIFIELELPPPEVPKFSSKIDQALPSPQRHL